MRIINIYKKYNIPPSLQEHLLRVTKVALFICDHWVGPKTNTELIKKAALLHDLGNIVKFDLKKYPELLGKDKSRVNFWLILQKKTIEKYGADDHQVTAKMLGEIGVNKQIVDIILRKSFGNSLVIEKSKSWELKILLYSDFRVGPWGVLPLKQRLNEMVNRLTKYKKKNNLTALIEACLRIEKQVQANTNIDVSDLSDESIKRSNEELLSIEI